MNSLIENLDKYLCKDVISIIIDYTYPKCCRCRFMGEDNNFHRMINNEYVCRLCYLSFDKFIFCKICHLVYDKTKSNYCGVCREECKVYCQLCSIIQEVDLSGIDLAGNF